MKFKKNTMAKRERSPDTATLAEISLQLTVNSKLIHIVNDILTQKDKQEPGLKDAIKALLEEKEELLLAFSSKRNKIDTDNNVTDEY